VQSLRGGRGGGGGRGAGRQSKHAGGQGPGDRGRDICRSLRANFHISNQSYKRSTEPQLQLHLTLRIEDVTGTKATTTYPPIPTPRTPPPLPPPFVLLPAYPRRRRAMFGPGGKKKDDGKKKKKWQEEIEEDLPSPPSDYELPPTPPDSRPVSRRATAPHTHTCAPRSATHNTRVQAH